MIWGVLAWLLLVSTIVIVNWCIHAGQAQQNANSLPPHEKIPANENVNFAVEQSYKVNR